MTILTIVLDNLKRRKVKSLFLLFGLAIGVATVVALVSTVQAMRLELGNELDRFGPNIVITPRFQGQDIYYGSTQVGKVAYDVKPLTESDLPKIRTIKDRESVNIISPKLIGAVTMQEKQVLLVGVEPGNEFKMKPWYSLQSWAGVAPGVDLPSLWKLNLPEDGLILGAGAAKAFTVQAGDPLSVNGSPFVVTGILDHLGAEEDGLVYANLSVVQRLLGRNGLYSMIEVSGFCNFCPIEDMASQMTTILPNGRVTALRQAALVREETINRFAAFGLTLSWVALLAAILFVITTMLSSVNERTQEIGIFRAIGFRRLHIVALIVLEAFIVSVFAGLIGFVAGNATAIIAAPYLAQMAVTVPWNLALILPAIALAVVLAVLSSLYPSLKAASLDPVESLRFI